MIKKILVPLDGSIQAKHALNFTFNLAGKYLAEIQLLTVVPPIMIPIFSVKIITGEAISECTRRLEENFKGVLSKATEKVKVEKKKNPNLRVSTRFEKGSPEQKIVKIAKEGDFDIIIMGSRGLGDRTFLGSVSSRVMQHATCARLLW